MEIQYQGQVAIVTGAGRGLGRAYAMELARRGAKVVVNDPGVATDGSGGSVDTAQTVVDDIEAAGGVAMASDADVADMEQVQAMVDAAMARWGRVDILVNNAGILRDRTFAKMSLDDFRAVLEVHLMGSIYCTKAVWGIMREQNYGRIVMTTSSTGLYGNFGQTNYAAAKMGVLGAMNTLAQEGAKYNIKVNAVAPSAGTRMGEGLLTADLLKLIPSAAVAPAVLYLVSEQAPTRTIIGAGAGTFSLITLHETRGVYLAPEEQTPEGIIANWDAIADRQGEVIPQAGPEQTQKFFEMAAAAQNIEIDIKFG